MPVCDHGNLGGVKLKSFRWDSILEVQVVMHHGFLVCRPAPSSLTYHTIHDAYISHVTLLRISSSVDLVTYLKIFLLGQKNCKVSTLPSHTVKPCAVIY